MLNQRDTNIQEKLQNSANGGISGVRGVNSNNISDNNVNRDRHCPRQCGYVKEFVESPRASNKIVLHDTLRKSPAEYHFPFEEEERQQQH